METPWEEIARGGIHPTKISILEELYGLEYPMSTTMLAERMGVSREGMRHHLKKLVSWGLVEQTWGRSPMRSTGPAEELFYQAALDVRTDPGIERERRMGFLVHVLDGILTECGPEQALDEASDFVRGWIDAGADETYEKVFAEFEAAHDPDEPGSTAPGDDEMSEMRRDG